MVTEKKRKLAVALCTVICVAVAAICVVLLIFPLPRTKDAAFDRYVCLWSDGSRTEETFAQAYAAFIYADEECIYLSGDGAAGEIETGEEYRRIYGVLENGSLADLLALQKGEISRLEQAALWRTFSDWLWYSEECFVWDGERVMRSERTTAETLVLLSGSFPKGFVKNSGAGALSVRAGAEVSSSDFSGSPVTSVSAEAPYSVSGGALYLSTAGGKRLIAVLPDIEALELEADVAYIDEGALSPCTQLKTLTVPFVGSAANALGTAYVPYFGWLFGTDETGGYAVPQTLKRVAVTGGTILSHAFYGCDAVEEIDASGAEYVEGDAFADCVSLRYLRTAFPVRLSGDFRTETDGAYTVYIKE